MNLDVICDRNQTFRAFVVKWRQVRHVMAQALLALAVTGCATLAGSGLTKDSVSQGKGEVGAGRAEARWGEVVAGNLPAAYVCLSPGTRSTKTSKPNKAKRRHGF